MVIDRRKFTMAFAVRVVAAVVATYGGASAQPAEVPPSNAAGGQWRSYEVYEPVIERYFVSGPSTQALQYNHCSAIAFFKNRWVAC